MLQIDLCRLSVTNSYYLTAHYFNSFIQKLDSSVGAAIKKHLNTALRIFILDGLLRMGSVLITESHIDASLSRGIQEEMFRNYSIMRP